MMRKIKWRESNIPTALRSLTDTIKRGRLLFCTITKAGDLVKKRSQKIFFQSNSSPR